MTKRSLQQVFVRWCAMLAVACASLAHAEMRAPDGFVDYAAVTPAAAGDRVITAAVPESAPLADADGARAEAFAIHLNPNLLPARDTLRAPETAQALDPAIGDPRRLVEDNAPYDDLWERIRDGFGLTASDSARVTRQVEWFENHEAYVDRLVERSRKYLFFIVDEVQKRGMPTEVALLPIVESAFNPVAISPAKASGIWQFMPATGKAYGMRQNWWYDGRRDIVAATNGALDYLEKLHTQFGAWDLALAAYNCGEGCVARAIERNQRSGRPTDYANLNLPEETRNYVPKLLAAREIVADPAAHGLILPPIADTPYFAAVTTNKHVDLAVAARFASLSIDDFLALNPGYNRPVILAQGEQTILVPVEHVETFTARLNDPEARLVSWRPHRLRRGENLASVASRFGMSSDELKRINGISALRRVAGGGTILVRDAHADEGDLDALAGNTPAEAELAAPTQTVTFSHRVRRGESLASVARRYNVSVASLRTWNRIPVSRGARIGQLLVMHRVTELGETDAAVSTPAAGSDSPPVAAPHAAPVFESALVNAAQRSRAHRGGRSARGARRLAPPSHTAKPGHPAPVQPHARNGKPLHPPKH